MIVSALGTILCTIQRTLRSDVHRRFAVLYTCQRNRSGDFMALLTTGKPFIKQLEQVGALATYAPLEGGFEGRYIRRLRSTGYECLSLTARGLSLIHI